ncbi:hypothetical protein CC1G_08635 [Coprinopsis cinerea okayama7|uniref:BZIP domain-containing protein n=1 Tax=Coprinopsis cinerea (strain Okayama-7 / 130 / ATCC MYA-4618 / FGSC 9003) TaxID=240176 RepID=A8N0T8_COPC7|nr:hypothetical protein CC1G_08635 [Coprinopsis cinerea okayama7\|eukprot:XP_001828489.2 hypothetical protein CC1G_08635 [Coprinopsis cinerea okayama7\
METFQDVPPLWDFPGAVNYSQMPDEDFMNLFSKQFPQTGAVVDPMSFGGGYMDNSVANMNQQQHVNNLPPPLPSLTPPSEDSSPSPPNSNQEPEEKDVQQPPKRKAADLPQDGPSSKSQHTMNNNEKKSATASTSATTSGNRRKSTSTVKDESRLLKRKEQNRAAQRAFRERKEKHVRDLEERVAELEAKNEEATHENENLRDLLARLQSENVMLKQQQFTFSMPRSTTDNSFPGTDMSAFNSGLASGSNGSFAAASSSKSPRHTNPLEWSSSSTFDPTRLNLLDDLPQPTATQGAMQLDFGFGNTGLASNAPYTSIAANPMFMSFASSFDSSTPSASTNSDSPNHSMNGGSTNSAFNFDFNSLTPWPTQTNNQENSLDDLLSNYMNNSNSYGNSYLTSPASVSPVAHHPKPAGLSCSTSSTSSPSSSSTDPLFTPKDMATPESDRDGAHHDTTKCPKNRSEVAKRVEEAGESPFAPSVQKCQDALFGTMISCSGSVSFPKTQKSDQNVEVLTAWRSITSNPKFKDTDISDLCAEFTAKARCDGQKVVLEPSGVVSILEKLSQKQQPQH